MNYDAQVRLMKALEKAESDSGTLSVIGRILLQATHELSRIADAFETLNSGDGATRWVDS